MPVQFIYRSTVASKVFFSIRNKYRKGLEELIPNLAPFNKTILSGDTNSERQILETIFDSKTTIRFNQTPFDKLEYIEQLQKKNNKLMMLGDGLNDSGAFASSTIGVAVTEDTSFFTPASDVIMDAKELTKLDKYFSAAQTSKKLVFIGFGISLLYNFVGLSFAVQGTLSPIVSAILMPISSISIVVFSTLTTNWMLKNFNSKKV